MADYDSALPIRTEADGTDERVHTKIVDYTFPGGVDKQAAVSEKNLHVVTNGVYDSVDNPKPSTSGLIAHTRGNDTGLAEVTTFTTLAAASLGVTGVLPCKYFTFHDGTTAYYVWFEVGGLGTDPAPGGTGIKVTLVAENADAVATATRAAINGSAALVAATGATDKVIITNDNIGLAADATAGTSGLAFTIDEQGVPAGVAEAQCEKRVTAVTSGDITALDVAMRDSSGAAITPDNPLPVYISESASGDEVLDFEEETAVATEDSADHSYTPTGGKTFALQQISASASGKMKVEIKIGLTGAEDIVVVLFNSTANPNVVYTFGAPQLMLDTMSVVVTLWNHDKQPQNLYSTIEGVEY